MIREKTDAELLLECADVVAEQARELKKLYKQKEKELYALRKHIQSVCNHKYADGRTAERTHHRYTSCRICKETLTFREV